MPSVNGGHIPWQAIPDFSITFGDTMIGLICLLSTTEASFSLILERPGINGTTAQLPNFGEIYFDSAMGGDGLTFSRAGAPHASRRTKG